MFGNQPSVRSGISSQELASALRTGLESRVSEISSAMKSLAAGGQSLDLLWPLASLIDYPAPPARGTVPKGVRLIRRIVKRLMSPWLAQQTRFNRSLLSELQSRFQLYSATELQDTVRHLRDQLNECNDKIDALSAGTGSGERFPEFEDAVENVFIQTWMPEPPGVALVLSDTTPSVLDALGFSVLHTSISDPTSLPLNPFSFRVILALSRGPSTESDVWAPKGESIRAWIAQLVSPGGRVFGSRRCRDERLSHDALAKLCEPLRLHEYTSSEKKDVWAAGV